MKLLPIVLAAVSALGFVTTERPSCVKRAAFSSTNFENILTWETEAEIPPGTVFDVQYKQYGEKSWLSKRECQSITRLFCNLSQETENFTELYYGRVRARGCSSTWVHSERFQPHKETVIGPPELEFIPFVRSIKFLIRPPLTPLRGEDQQQLTVEDIYSKFQSVDYQLIMFNPRTRQQWTKTEHNKEFEVFNLDPDTEYNGTVFICVSQRRSKAQVFRVKTVPDRTWILYFLVALAFCAGLLFAAVAFVIYKYIKERRAQPRALDFRGIPSFQPLTLTVEHIIKPLNLSKLSLFLPEVQLAQMSQHLDWALEPARPLCPYQQQIEIPTFQLPPRHSQLEILMDYAPQKAEQSIPAGKNLALTYGVCGDGTDSSSQAQQKLKEPSPDVSVLGELQTGLGKSCSHWDYKEQQPKVALGKGRDRLESVVLQMLENEKCGSQLENTECVSKLENANCVSKLENANCASQVRLENANCVSQLENTEYVSQLENAECVSQLENADCVSPLSLSLLEHGGCYRQQAKLPPLLAAEKTDPDYAPEESLLPPLSAALLLSVRTGDDFPEENSQEQWMLLESFPYSAQKVQMAEIEDVEMFPMEKGLSCTELSTEPSSAHTSTPLTMLFKDLDLKVQWGEDESTGFY
uniref:Interleukin-22 receptor subunit alpha-1 n=2 Tax=Malurus TaxID=55806 RepID=A0A8C5T7J5_9PASS